MPHKKKWGAKPSEWNAFKELGLTQDMLPVVSRPDAPVSKNSTMKFLGKTPSLYNKENEVVGIGKWTQRKSTPKQVQHWRKNTDYGICLQTRYVRAFDIDIEDTELVAEIIQTIQDVSGVTLPIRARSNSAKCLLAFRLVGELGKRTIKVGEGMVEFLANGQQFVAAGTHPSGKRYNWTWAVEDEIYIPELSAKQFEAVMFVLESEFGTEPSTRKGLRKRGERSTDKQDATYDFLEQKGLVLEYGDEGQAHIECPFSDEHTTESVVSATSYFPAGSRGYDRGHFVCLHAHCAHRTDEDFEEALGVIEDDFEVVELSDEEKEVEVPDDWKRDKHGQPKAIINNVVSAISRPNVCGVRICYDNFRDEIVYFDEASKKWERENDERFTRLCMMLEKHYDFHPIPTDRMRNAVRVVAKDNEIDTAREWLNDLEWDGVPRIDNFLSTYFGADESEYTRSVSLYIWTAAAGRILVPGLKADMIPIAKGPQGYRKSTAIAALVPEQDLFCELDFDESDDNLARKMRGVLVAEIPELRGLRTQAIEAIKAFVARTHEKWIPKYKEFSITFPRRCVFIATTNEDEFLADSTGNRRWLPFEVLGPTDIDAIIRDRAQLWAEARERFKQDGLLFQEAEELGKDEHQKYTVRDEWVDVLSDWLYRPEGLDGEDQRPIDREYLRIIDVARDALNIDPRQLKRVDKLRIAECLRALNYENKAVRLDVGGRKKLSKVWVNESFNLA